DKAAHAAVARRLAASSLSADAVDDEMRQKFESSVIQLLGAFADGGYTRIAALIEDSVPEEQRDNAAQTYIKIISGAAFEANNLARERAGKELAVADEETLLFLQDSLNSLSDLFF